MIENNNTASMKNSSAANENKETVINNYAIQIKTMNYESRKKLLEDAGVLDAEGNLDINLLSAVLMVSSYAGKNVKLFARTDLKSIGVDNFVFDAENREVKISHVKNLYKSVKDSKMFMESIKVITALDAIRKGIKLVDIKGNKVDLNTPGIGKMVLVLDGQHRYTCCRLHDDINCEVEFIDIPGDSMQYYGVVNGLKLKQGGADATHTIITRYGEDANLLSQMKKMSEVFGITEKCAERYLTGKVDQIKLADKTKLMKDGTAADKLPEKYKVSNEQIERAYKLANLIIYKFGDEKSAKKLELATAVMALYASLAPAAKANFVNDFTAFLCSVSETETQEILEMVGTKQEDFNTNLAAMYNTYMESHDAAVRDKTLAISAVDLKKHQTELDANADEAKKKAAPVNYWVELDEKKRAEEKKKAEEKAAKKASSSPQKAPVIQQDYTDNKEDSSKATNPLDSPVVTIGNDWNLQNFLPKNPLLGD